MSQVNELHQDSDWTVVVSRKRKLWKKHTQTMHTQTIHTESMQTLTKPAVSVSLLKKFHEMQKVKKMEYIELNSHRNDTELAEPFTESVIDEFEMNNKCHLPEDFRWYIINCSKEIFMSYYPTVIDLRYVYSNLKKMTCKVREGVSMIGWGKQKHEETFRPCCLEIGNDGCAYYICMVIKGNLHGTIWNHRDPEYLLAAKSFTHLVLHHVKMTEKGICIPSNEQNYPLLKKSCNKHYSGAN